MDNNHASDITKNLEKWAGVEAKQALAEVQAAYPGYTVNLVAVGGIITADYRLDRIRLTYLNVDGVDVIVRGRVG